MNLDIRSRLLQLASVPSFLFVAVFLAACYLLKGPDFAAIIGIGVIAGFASAAIAVASKDAGKLRFTDRSLLFAMTAVAALLVWTQPWKLDPEQAIAAIESLGGEVDVRQQGQNRGAISSASIIRKPINARDLRHLCSLSNLVSLDLDYCHFGDRGLRYVGRLTDLTRLDIEDTAISDDGLRSLVRLQKLEYVILDGNNITDDGLLNLAALKSLTRVRVRNTKITERGAKALEKALPGCEVILN